MIGISVGSGLTLCARAFVAWLSSSPLSAASVCTNARYHCRNRVDDSADYDSPWIATARSFRSPSDPHSVDRGIADYDEQRRFEVQATTVKWRSGSGIYGEPDYEPIFGCLVKSSETGLALLEELPLFDRIIGYGVMARRAHSCFVTTTRARAGAYQHQACALRLLEPLSCTGCWRE